MKIFLSHIAPFIEQFIDYRIASGTWNETCYGLNIRIFDRFCAKYYPQNMNLTQDMVNNWCTKRDTEINTSHYVRTRVITTFISYLKDRKLTNVLPPITFKLETQSYIPHSFNDEELLRFFHECDFIKSSSVQKTKLIRKFTIPVFFRLLYSSGIRTTEARFLKVAHVDLKYGVLNIQQSKGYDQHYVAMHDTMTNLMYKYNEAISEIQPKRTYFFESIKGTHYSKDWVSKNFRSLWDKVNETKTTVSYDLRHNYATTNINSWIDSGFEIQDKLSYLSKSMGHRSIESTRYYYSIVPQLADTLYDRTMEGFNAMIPEVYNYEK